MRDGFRRDGLTLSGATTTSESVTTLRCLTPGLLRSCGPLSSSSCPCVRSSYGPPQGKYEPKYEEPKYGKYDSKGPKYDDHYDSKHGDSSRGYYGDKDSKHGEDKYGSKHGEDRYYGGDSKHEEKYYEEPKHEEKYEEVSGWRFGLSSPSSLFSLGAGEGGACVAVWGRGGGGSHVYHSPLGGLLTAVQGGEGEDCQDCQPAADYRGTFTFLHCCPLGCDDALLLPLSHCRSMRRTSTTTMMTKRSNTTRALVSVLERSLYCSVLTPPPPHTHRHDTPSPFFSQPTLPCTETCLGLC